MCLAVSRACLALAAAFRGLVCWTTASIFARENAPEDSEDREHVEDMNTSAGETRPRVMVIFAHPDDAEFLCSGTVARFTRHGYRVQYVLATSGDKGSNDPDATPEQLIATREAEQHAAADVLGIEEVTFLRHMDGELEVSVPDLALDSEA